MEKTQKLGAEIRFLGRVLGEVIREQAGQTLFELEEEIRLGARARRDGKPDAERALVSRIRSMSDLEARTVVRAFTLFFDLVNLAEDRERVRILRERERHRYPEPRSESMEDGVLLMSRAGLDPARSQALLDLLSIRLVFTAHPTEAKRRSVRAKVRFLRQTLQAMDTGDLLPGERERLVTRVRSLLTGLWQTDLVRPRRPSVLEEVEVGLYFLATLWEITPVLYAELERSLAKIHPGVPFHPPAFLTFGSWIGGDRDGNPAVTAQVTTATLQRMRRSAVEAHLAQCRLVFDELTSSEREIGTTPELRKVLQERLERFPEAAALMDPISPFETYRRFLQVVDWRLTQTLGAAAALPGGGAYANGDELAADLVLVRDSLVANRGSHIGEGELQRWIWQVRVFGLYFARLDIRQESTVNARVVARLLSDAGIAPDYLGLPEEERLRVLHQVLATGLQLPASSEASWPDEVRETLALFAALRSVADGHGEDALGGYIISMTHRVSDVLAVFLLWEARLEARDKGTSDVGARDPARPCRPWTSSPCSKPSRTWRTRPGSWETSWTIRSTGGSSPPEGTSRW